MGWFQLSEDEKGCDFVGMGSVKMRMVEETIAGEREAV